ncbi:lipopolysaccharide biosynthesis protein [Sphingomonas sp. AP4-R1]|uniref:lipopolysaccharide biosynthesis protein n=1 Tax=Sphingomonas sp. AP4-R1 TaxID=2735134 RepID=UPI0020A34076|nr:oligosaccharide flippase family protein [Sphingomonas sp. AP4-R1]
MPPDAQIPDSAPETALAPVPGALRRLLANIFRLLSGKAAAGLLSLVYLVIVAHQLGARDYGLLMLVNAYAVTVGSLVAFSGFHGVVRYGALSIADGDTAGLARLIRFMGVIELSCGAAAILIAAIGAPLVGPHLGWSVEAERFAVPYALAVMATVRATPQGVLQLADRFDLIGLHQTVSPIVRMAGVLIVWLSGGGLVGYLSVWLISSVAEGVAMWLLALPAWRKLLAGEPVFGAWRGVTEQRDGFGRFILLTNFDITLRELAPNLAPLTVGWFLGPAGAGLYALAQRATNILQQPAVLLSQASFAILAEQAAMRDLSRMWSTVWSSTFLALGIGGVIVLALGGYGEVLMQALGGHSFRAAGMLVILVGCGRALALGTAPAAAALTALGRPGLSVAVALAINLALYPLLPLLLHWQGIDGAGWHVLAQNLMAFLLVAGLFAREARVRA